MAIRLPVVEGVASLQQDAGRGRVSQAVPHHVGADQGGAEGHVRVVEDLAVDEVETGRHDVDRVVVKRQAISNMRHRALLGRLPALHGRMDVSCAGQNVDQ